MFRIGLKLLLAALGFAGLGCAAPKDMPVALDYRPREGMRVSQFTGALPIDGSVKFFITVEDHRDAKDTIGISGEGQKPRIPVLVSGEKQPAQFVQEALARDIASAGLPVVTDRAKANRLLTVKLQRFYVDEAARYMGEVRGIATLADPAGKQLWQGLVGGSAEVFGRSRNPENHQEALSDATRQMITSMLANPGFQAALKL